MPTKDKQTRCERCFHLVPVSALIERDGDMMCPTCVGYFSHCDLAKTKKAPKYAKVDKTKPSKNGKSHAPTYADIAIPSKQWYAVAVVGSDIRVRRAIIDRLTTSGLRHAIGRVVIPREPTVKAAKPRWEALDYTGAVIGRVSAETPDEALHAAKLRWEKTKGGRGVWHPQPADDTFEKLTKSKEKVGKVVRNVFSAVSNTGRVMGRVIAKTEKLATVQAMKLYGPDAAKKSNPREAPTRFYDVKEVRLERVAGTAKMGTRRAMPGYILMQLKPDDDVFLTVKRTPGVTGVLPFFDKVTYEDIEHATDTIDLPKPPVSIPQAVVEVILEKPKLSSPEKYSVGDAILVTEGQWDGQQSVVKKDMGDGKYQIELLILGSVHTVTVDAGQMRLVNSGGK